MFFVKAIIAFVIGVLISYLMCSTYVLSANIADWSLNVRWVFSFVFIPISLFAALMTGANAKSVYD